MKISNAISEITVNKFSNNKIETEKNYIWPQYGAGKVNKIRGVVRKTGTNAIYSKPIQNDKDKIIKQLNEKNNSLYSAKGNIDHKKIVIQPGLLFDAIA